MTKITSGMLAVLSAVLIAGGALPTAGGALAQANYPERPIRMIVAFPPGGPSDIVARLMADKLTEALGRPAVVENVSGASGNIGTERVAKSVPDGHTLLISAPGPLVVNPSLYQKVPFDPIRDFAPISQLCFTPNVLVVNNDVPVKSVQELIALARKDPGKLSSHRAAPAPATISPPSCSSSWPGSISSTCLIGVSRCRCRISSAAASRSRSSACRPRCR